MSSIHWALEHRARAIVALCTALCVAVLLAACGEESGGGGGETADARALLEQTFTGTHRIDSGKVDLSLTLVAKGDPSLRGPIELTVRGPFQNAGEDLPKFDLALDVSAQGQTFRAGAISTTDRLWIKFGGTSYAVPAELVSQLRAEFRKAQERPQEREGLSLGSLRIQPLDWLRDPQVAGEEDVAGTETSHVTAQLDVDAFLDDVEKLLAEVRKQGVPGAGGQLPERLTDEDRRQVKDAIERATVDVWTGTEDKTLRKLAVSLGLDLPEGSGDGPSSADVELVLELQELNQEQTVEAPASSRPLDELLSQLGGLLGGALGGAGASGSGSGSGSAEQLDAYTQCLEDAGSDVERMQECAALLEE